jgi:sortase A
MNRRLRPILGACLLLAGLALAGQALWLQGKALVAQQLIAHAWEQTLRTGQPVKPWRWADTWPVARLTEPGGRQHYVLASVSGQALAFGPGHHPASARPGEAATMLLAGHQDSHFAFLQHLQPGQRLTVQDSRGVEHVYRVDTRQVVDSTRQTMRFQQGLAELRLVTCYPFASLQSGGPLRYVVSARLEPVT